MLSNQEIYVIKRNLLKAKIASLRDVHKMEKERGIKNTRFICKLKNSIIRRIEKLAKEIREYDRARSHR